MSFQTDLIIKFRDQGLTIKEISKLMKISKATVVFRIGEHVKGREESCICTHSFLVQGCTCGYKGNNDNPQT